jgi:hypothetical protein
MRALLLIPLLLVAACDQKRPAADVGLPPAEPAAAAPAPVPAPSMQPMALKSPLPEGFELPFEYHRLYDNTGKTQTGALQRRIMVEVIGQDAAAARDALSGALAGKGFSAPASDLDDGLERLVYRRPDGTVVTVKINPAPKRLRAPDARATVHLVWDTI